jgi:hypothetical protein
MGIARTSCQAGAKMELHGTENHRENQGQQAKAKRGFEHFISVMEIRRKMLQGQASKAFLGFDL